jgi:hypothetical protein
MRLALFAALAVAALVTACSSKPADDRPAVIAAAAPAAAPPAAAPGPAAAQVALAAPAAAGVPADFPADCVAYAALIDRLASCDKIGGARDGLRAGYAAVRSTWAAVPASRRGELGAQCRVQADSLRDAAAATCSW